MERKFMMKVRKQKGIHTGKNKGRPRKIKGYTNNFCKRKTTEDDNRKQGKKNRRHQRGTEIWENKQQATRRNAEIPNESSQRIRRNYKERDGNHSDHRRS